MFEKDFMASVQSRLSKPETMLIITFQMILFKRRGSVKRPWSKNWGNNFSEAVFKAQWGWVHNLGTLRQCRITEKKTVTLLMDDPTGTHV